MDLAKQENQFIAEIKHLYIDREDKKEEKQILQRVLGELEKEGKLKRNDGLFTM